MADTPPEAVAQVASGKRSLFLAAGIVIAAATAAEAFFNWVGAPTVFGHLASAAFLPTISVVHARINGRRTRSLLPVPEGIVRREGFTLRTYELVVYGALIALAALQLSGFVAGVVAGIFLEEGDSILPVLLVATVFGTAIVTYLVGTWFGSRAGSRPLLTLIAAMVLAKVLGVIIDFLALPSDSFEEVFDQERTWQFFGISLVAGVVTALAFTLVFGALGVWRGRRRQEAAYFHYLIGRLPESERETLVALAYEEAARYSSAQADGRERAAAAQPGSAAMP